MDFDQEELIHIMLGLFKSRIAWAAVILAFAILTGLEILKVRGVFTPSRVASEVGGEAVSTGPEGHRIAGRSFVVGPAQNDAPLVVVLHGDAPGRKPSYQYIFASTVAKAVPGTRVVALLRPGYADPYGGRSDGDRGNFAAGENYTPGVVADLASAIRDVKTRFGSRNVILVGHSGGAALTADIAALNAGLVQVAVLVSCPCNVSAFRAHMAREQFSPVWLLPVNAISPLQALSRMSAGTSIAVISGTEDPFALPQYSQEYVDSAKALGLNASLISILGKAHEILLLPEVIEDVVQIVRKSGPE